MKKNEQKNFGKLTAMTAFSFMVKGGLRYVLAMLGIVLALNSYAQLPLVRYKPVIVPRTKTRSNTTTPNYNQQQYSQPQPSYTTIGAYYVDKKTNSFKRTKIKISLTQNTFGETVLYVRGVLDRSFTQEYWQDANIMATKVNKYSDAEVIVNNFEYKANVYLPGIATVYFNY